MSAMYKSNTKVLYTKKETTPGTNADPLNRAGGYANSTKLDIRFRNVEANSTQNFDNNDSKYANGGDSGDPAVPTTTVADVKFDIKFAPGEFIKDTNDVANEHKLNYKVMLQASGLDVIEIKDPLVSDAEYSYPKKYLTFPSIKMAEQTVTQAAVTTNTNGEGIAMDAVGLSYNISLTADGAASPLSFSFEAQGQGNEEYDISLADMGLIGYDSDLMMDTIASRFVMTDITLTENVVGATPIVITTSKMSIESGNQMYLKEDQSSATGISHNLISAKQPRFNITPEYKSVSEFDSYKALVKAKSYTVECTFHDKNAKDNTDFIPLQIIIPHAQMISASVTDDNGFLREDLQFIPKENRRKFIPNVQYNADATGTLTDFDFTGTDLDTLAFDATWYMIISEEYTKDLV